MCCGTARNSRLQARILVKGNLGAGVRWSAVDASAAVRREAMCGMARVATAVLPAYIGDGGIRPLGLHLERGDERIFGVDRHAVRLALGPEAHGVMGWHGTFHFAA